MLEMAMDSFTQEFPEITDCRLFICVSIIVRVINLVVMDAWI